MFYPYKDTISRTAILPIAYHNITRTDAMPSESFSNKSVKGSYRGLEFRLIPGCISKARKLSGTAGACRFVWNTVLSELNEDFIQSKKEDRKPTSKKYFSLSKRFSELRKEIPWLSKYSYKSVRYTLKYQSDAWHRYFKGESNCPKFRSKYGHVPSFTIPEDVKIRDGHLHIPKVGWMQIRRKGGNPYIDGRPIQATVKKVGLQWRVSILYEIDSPKKIENGNTVGIDLNTYNIACTYSTGVQEMLDIPKLTDKEIKIRRYQRKLARQQKGSGRRNRTKRKIAKCKRSQKNARKNTAHQHSSHLAKKAETLIREDLNVKSMSKSAKGTIENPGTNVKAKSGLNRVIRNSGWTRFNTYCDYKFANVITVPAMYTSQTCNKCGCVDKANRQSQAKFKCVSCGHADHADLNASANILACGIRAAGRGGAFSLETPMIRQIDTYS